MATKTRPAAPAPTKQQAPDDDGPPPDFRDLLIEQLKIIRDALPDGNCPLEFADGPGQWPIGEIKSPIANELDRWRVIYAVAYLRGAHEAMDITMSEMLDNEGIDPLQLDTEH